MWCPSPRNLACPRRSNRNFQPLVPFLLLPVDKKRIRLIRIIAIIAIIVIIATIAIIAIKFTQARVRQGRATRRRTTSAFILQLKRRCNLKICLKLWSTRAPIVQVFVWPIIQIWQSKILILQFSFWSNTWRLQNSCCPQDSGCWCHSADEYFYLSPTGLLVLTDYLLHRYEVQSLIQALRVHYSPLLDPCPPSSKSTRPALSRKVLTCQIWLK